MLEIIQSRNNEKVKYACLLATSAGFRAQEGMFFAEGKRLCLDLAQQMQPEMVFVSDAAAKENRAFETLGKQVFGVSNPVLAKLSKTKAPQGVVCLFKKPKAVLDDINPEKGVLFCEDVQDPANVGAMLRSAAAFGFGGVVLTGASADAFSPKSLRASAGSVLRLPVVVCENMQKAADFLKQKGVKFYAAALDGGENLYETKCEKPFALLVGNEGTGLSKAALAKADKRVYVPMQNGVESLNAAVAASVLMFHFSSLQP